MTISTRAARRAAIGLPIALFMLVLISCAPSGTRAATSPVSGPRFIVSLVPGPNYRSTATVLVFKLHYPPQAACWIETPDGKYLDTVYVTTKGSTKKWYSAPSAGRPEALPVWSHAALGAAASADAVSGATPGGATHHEAAAPRGLPVGRYVAKLEVNVSYDYNDRYTPKNAGVNGQPSLVYQTDIVVGEGQFTGVFAPIGVGSVDGSDGAVTPGLSGITTALTILQSAQIEYVGN
jgi:hypothetical protein